ncbi:PH domain-containing protein [Candidatus Parcubacteria bacterium]|jgi:membrane protein YdbS with pleckstrin-like domain|nr:PH domain-containing protein [Candidatus Parcubacteria bacterium]
MQNLNPKVVWIFFFQFIIGGLFLLFFLMMFLGPIFAVKMADQTITPFFWILKITLPFALYLVFCFVWAKLTYRFWLYDITEDAYKIEQGVIWKRYVSIPYERIQNVDIHRGVIARLLGLSELRIQTAGFGGAQGKWGSFSEGRLPGISKERAEQLREELISKVKGKKQGL